MSTEQTNDPIGEPVIAHKFPAVRQVESDIYFWCTCGKSKGQPFCDGAHRGTLFSPLKVDIDEPKTVAWCQCKHTKAAPFCDGSHMEL